MTLSLPFRFRADCVDVDGTFWLGLHFPKDVKVR